MSATSYALPVRENHRTSSSLAWPVEIAPRQVLSREINERIGAQAESSRLEHELEFICECSRCSFEPLTLRRGQYEAVRRFSTRFLVKPGHVAEEQERVVEEGAGYAVVEKIGSSARTAIRFDPRRRKQRMRSEKRLDNTG